MLKLLALIPILALAGCSRQATNLPAVKSDQTRNPAPDFTTMDSSGRQVSLSDYNGKVVLLNFWATWCAPCRVEIPWFIEFQRAYKDRGFTVVGVSMDEKGWTAIRPFAEQLKMNYPMLLATPEVAMLYTSMAAIPTTYMIDRQGRIAKVDVGMATKAEYQRAIEALLH